MGGAPAGGADNLVNEESLIDVQLDQRHMMLRGETVNILYYYINYHCMYYVLCSFQESSEFVPL